MTAEPNMAAITALERSLQNCSLHHHQTTTTITRSGGGDGDGDEITIARTSSSNNSDLQDNKIQDENRSSTEEVTLQLELNSHTSLPYGWEQCLDLKTGELYYINWRTGMKSKENPRRKVLEDFYSGDDDDDDDDDDSSSYDDDEDLSDEEEEEEEEEEEVKYFENIKIDIDHSNQSTRAAAAAAAANITIKEEEEEYCNVLVVGGCNKCFMYMMVPKQVEDCPKCSAQLLHFTP